MHWKFIFYFSLLNANKVRLTKHSVVASPILDSLWFRADNSILCECRSEEERSKYWKIIWCPANIWCLVLLGATAQRGTRKLGRWQHFKFLFAWREIRLQTFLVFWAVGWTLDGTTQTVIKLFEAFNFRFTSLRKQANQARKRREFCFDHWMRDGRNFFLLFRFTNFSPSV